MTAEPNKTPPEPQRKQPPAFGGRPDKGEGLATDLGVAQPTETDRPEPKTNRRKP